MGNSRSGFIDFFRGIVIFDMILVHYSKYVNVMPGFQPSKLISYTDFAIEGFLFLSGLMLGHFYLDIFKTDPLKGCRKIVSRILEIIRIHYIMLLTISLPLVWLLGSKVTEGDTNLAYMVKSFLFMEQTGLLHILPTFIPLFILAVPALYLLRNGHRLWLLGFSIIVFIVGNTNPYLFNIGERTIFPVIVWQIFFFLGVLTGDRTGIDFDSKQLKRMIPWFVLSLIVFLSMTVFGFGHNYIEWIAQLKSDFGLQINKFPLNYLGFFYRGSLLALAFFLAFFSWKMQWIPAFLSQIVSLFGRNSLSVFVIHVYFAKLIFFYENYFTPETLYFSYLLVFLNIFVTIFYLKRIEKQRAFSKTNQSA